MLSPGNAIDRWIVMSCVGEDWYGTAYLVRDRSSGTIARAVLLSSAHAGTVRRYGEVHWSQARSRHPSQLALYDIVHHGGTLALVTQTVDGQSLAEALEEYTPTMEEVEASFRDIVAGVADAHERGLVHRDLAPDMIVLDQGRPRVGGLGRFGIVDRTMDTTYAAPEGAGDVAADIYSLGAILHHLCFGGPPPMDIDLDPLPPHLARALRGCLAEAREDRFQSCRELLDVLDERSFPKVGRLSSEVPLRDDGVAEVEAAWPGWTFAAATAAVVPVCVAIATVVMVGLFHGSTPAPPGSSMLVGSAAALSAPSGDRTCRARSKEPLGWTAGVPNGEVGTVWRSASDLSVYPDTGSTDRVSCTIRKGTPVRLGALPVSVGTERWGLVALD